MLLRMDGWLVGDGLVIDLALLPGGVMGSASGRVLRVVDRIFRVVRRFDLEDLDAGNRGGLRHRGIKEIARGRCRSAFLGLDRAHATEAERRDDRKHAAALNDIHHLSSHTSTVARD
jgi:hypothetical protein